MVFFQYGILFLSRLLISIYDEIQKWLIGFYFLVCRLLLCFGMKRNEYKSETGQLTHVRKNVFTFGQVVVTKYLGGYCIATLGNAMSWEANSEQELIDRLIVSGYGKNHS